MKNIIYLNNYMDDKILNARNNKPFYSQPANNKISGIVESITSTGNQLEILSSGLMNNRTGKKYNKIYSNLDNIKVTYCELIDIPLINTISSIIYIYKEIKRLHKLKKIDNIIFYNYKPEVAFAALLAKKRLKIPITIEYEDGYKTVKKMGKIKKLVFNYTENKVSKNVDSAILVNSILEKEYKVPTIVVRGIVNPKFFNECKNYKRERNKVFTILYSGGLDETRGVNVLIDAIKNIDFDLKLIITGKGQIKFDDKRIEFKGFMPYDEMKKTMMQSDLLVQCQLVNNSFSNVSFPSKIFEYICTNNFIISSKVADITEFLQENILYYENDSPIELSNKIVEVYNTWKNEKKRNNNLEKLCEENLPKKIGKKIINILK